MTSLRLSEYDRGHLDYFWPSAHSAHDFHLNISFAKWSTMTVLCAAQEPASHHKSNGDSHHNDDQRRNALRNAEALDKDA